MTRRSSNPSGRQEGNQKDDACGCGSGYHYRSQSGNKNQMRQNPNRDTSPQRRRDTEETDFEETDFLGSHYNQDQQRSRRNASSNESGYPGRSEDYTEETIYGYETERNPRTTTGRDYSEGNTRFQAETNKPRRGRPRKQGNENPRRQDSSNPFSSGTSRREKGQSERGNQDF